MRTKPLVNLLLVLSVLIYADCSCRLRLDASGTGDPSIAGGIKPVGLNSAGGLSLATDIDPVNITTLVADAGKLLVSRSGGTAVGPAWGSSGWVLTSNGPSIDPTFAPPISSNDNYTICTGFRITAAAGTWAGTGCTLTVPYAGKFTMKAHVRYALNATSNLGAIMSFRFRNITTGTDYVDSARITSQINSSSYNTVGTVPMEFNIVVTAGNIIEIYGVKINGLGTGFTESATVSDSNGSTMIFWEQKL